MFSILPALFEDPCGGLIAAAVILFVGNYVVADRLRCRQIGIALGGLTFLMAFIAGILEGRDIVGIIAASLGWSGVVLGSVWIMLPILTALGYACLDPIRRMRERQRQEEAQRVRDQQDHDRREAEFRHQEELARIAAEREKHKPVPPTKQELLAQAKQRYEATLRGLENAGLDAIELATARARAKQRYLRDIEEAMR